MGAAAHLGYSPYCVPTSMGDVKCVVVSEALKDVEPMVWDFVMNFARTTTCKWWMVACCPEGNLMGLY